MNAPTWTDGRRAVLRFGRPEEPVDVSEVEFFGS